MPFRLDEFTAKIQFATSASMPMRIYEACLATGIVSNTVYCQYAICEALSRDLGIPLEDLLAELPEPRSRAKHLFNPEEPNSMRGTAITKNQTGGKVMTGPANTIEEVK